MASSRGILLTIAAVLLCGAVVAFYIAFMEVPHPDIARGRERLAQLETGQRTLTNQQSVELVRASMSYVESVSGITDVYRQACRSFGWLMLAGAMSHLFMWRAMRPRDATPPAA